MERDRYLELLRSDGDALAAAASKDLQAPVPSCPDWDVAELIRHTSRVHRHKTGIVERGAVEQPPGSDTQPGPGPHDDLIDWYRAGLDDLVRSLDSKDPDAPAWSWAGDHRVAFWVRRMAHETAVHRWDAEAAVGAARDIDPELASDGIDEFLGVFIPREGLPYGGVAGTVHLHCTDVDGEWTVMLRPGVVPIYAAGHSKGDAAVRGPASDLLLFVWRRIGRDRVEVIGDEAIVDDLWAYFEGPGQ